MVLTIDDDAGDNDREVKTKNWVERQHQTGMRLQQRFRTVQSPLVHTLVQAKANS
jgi:hypothetical protein